MSWFKLDDGFYSHPKVAALFEGPCPGDAIALFALAGSWCSKELTDGAVPLGFVRRSGLHSEAAAELVRVRLFDACADGSFRVHNYLKFNPSREQVLATREATKQRVTRHRNGGSNGVTNGDGNVVTPAVHSGRNGVGTLAPVPVPVPEFSSENKSYPDAAEASHAHAREDFGGGRVLREVLPREPTPAARGARWLSDATRQEAFGHAGNWAPFLAEIDAKPEAQKRAAAPVLRAEAAKPDVADMLNPKHVSDWWHCYGQGKAPGKRSSAQSPDAQSARAKLAKCDEALTLARRKLAKLDPSEDDYESKLFDLEREEREAEEARDRAKRKVDAAASG